MIQGGTAGNLTLIVTPLHETKLCSLMSHPNQKDFTGHHHTTNGMQDSYLSKIDNINSKLIETKRRFK